MINKCIVKPLSESEYFFYSNILNINSGEYGAMIEWTKYFFDKNNIANPTILSIGAGTGEFDISIIQNMKSKPTFYYAIESNKKNFIKLVENLTISGIKHIVSNKHFDHKFYFDNLGNYKFDIIIIQNYLCLVDDPVKTILHARKFLKNKSQLIIFLQTKVGIYNFFTKYKSKLFWEKKPYANHTLNIDNIIEKLEKDKIKFRTINLPSMIYLEDYFNDKKEPNENIHNILTFFLQTNTRKLPKIFINDIISYLVKNINDNYEFLHPTGIIVVD